ncbi:MAG: DinB family protein [Chloroflexia bacterium]
MDSITLLREQLRAAHEYLDGTMADVTPEMLHWIPPGQATPLGANYLHLAQSEDMIVNGLLLGKEPLANGEWAGRLGASEPMPPPGTEADDYMAWSRRLRLDMPAFMEYARAVYQASDAYIATLTPDDLDREIDVSAMGMSPVTLSWVLSRYVVGHADNICGEASCMKGLQGADGYAG